MTKSNSQESSDITISDLVVVLNELRDALVNASLTLQDRLFEFDLILKNAAIERANELLKKTKATD